MSISKLNATQLLLNAIEAHDYTEVEYAIDQGADVHIGNALYCAVASGRIDIINAVLGQGANVSKSFFETSVLSCAIAKRYFQIAPRLLREKTCVIQEADILCAAKTGNEDMIKLLFQSETGRILFEKFLQSSKDFLLREAVESGNPRLVKYLHQFDKNMDKLDLNGDTPLLTAIRNNNIEMVRALIELGADINLRPKSCPDFTPLRFAVRANRVEIVQLLLSKGASLDTCVLGDAQSSEITRLLIRHGLTAKDYTPLHLASGDGDLNILGTLLACSEIVIDSNHFYFGTPLFEAVRSGQCEAARLLLSHGADVNFTTRDGSPLLIAVKAKQYDAVKLLLSKGANVNGLKNIESPLQVAASQGSIEIVQLLLEYKADVHLEKGHFHFPLGEAARHGHDEIVKVLLEQGADVNQKSQYLFSQATALHLACGEGSSNSAEVVNLLLDYGADINARNSLQETPLYCAANFRKDRAARALLREQGSIIKIKENGQNKISHQHVDVQATNKDEKTAFNIACEERFDPWETSVLRKIYEMLRAKEALPKIYDSEFQNLFKRIIEVGLDGLKDRELGPFYADRERSIPIGKFVREFEAEIKKANKLFLYARSENSYFQRALRSAGLPAEMAAHVASFVTTEHLPYDRGGKTWFDKIQNKPKSIM